jgi:hypothetical protein
VPAGGKAFAQCGQRRQIPGGKGNHPAHQVDAPDLLGHAVLHLQTGIHFEEIKACGIAVVDKLDRAGAAVIHRFTQMAASHNALSMPSGRFGAGSLPALSGYGAVPSSRARQGNHLALAVAKNLHFQMARALDVLLNKHARIAKVVFAQPHHRVKGLASSAAE